MASLHDIDRWLATEQFRNCLRQLTEAAVADDPALRFRRIRALAATGSADRALLEIEQIVESDALPPSEIDEAWALSIELYGEKRCRERVEAQLAAARTAVGDTPRLQLAEARARRALDQRVEAETSLAKSSTGEGADAARIELGVLCYVRGDFARAKSLLRERATELRDEAGRLRALAGLLAACDDYLGEAEAWAALAALLPDSDARPSMSLNHAFALAAAEQLARAAEEFTALWQAYPNEGAGRYARRCATRLAEADPSARRVRLHMPTTHQKRDYCGPAVLEICLRALGIELDQELIAREIKREHGTPMYEIVHFLAKHGVEARRIVVDDQRLCAAIDLGLPVILQEEYATTSHVAVVSGYDARLGVLIVHDPMTHRTSTRPFGWTDHSSQLFGGGAVLVIGKRPVSDERLRAIDASGLVHAPHLSLLDDLSRRRASTQEDGQVEDASAEETLAVTERALELAPDFRLARLRKLYAELSIAVHSGDQDAEDRFVFDLYGARKQFPNDEWPCLVHARFLMAKGYYSEALGAYRDAALRDPGDGNNLAAMGDCKRLMGRFDEAEELLFQGLEKHAEGGVAESTLLALYVRELELAADDGASPLFATHVPAEPSRRLPYDRPELMRRARHFALLACELQPNNAFSWEYAGLSALHADEYALAELRFERARGLRPATLFAGLGLAHCLAHRQAFAEAETCLQGLIGQRPNDAVIYHQLAKLHGQRQQPANELETLKRALAHCADKRGEFVAPLLAALRRELSPEGACAALRGLCEQHDDDLDLMWTAARALDNAGQRGHALALLRKAVSLAPDSVSPLALLGTLLVEDWLTRGEGRELLARAVTLAPSWRYPRRSLALAHADDPERGLHILSPVLEQEDPYLYEVQSLLLAKKGDTAGSDRARRRAISAFGESEFRALDSLCNWHLRESRYDRAMLHAKQLLAIEVEASDDEERAATVLSAHRLSGRVREISSWVDAKCADGVPEALAWDVYYGFCTINRQLAGDAARLLAGRAQSNEESSQALEWQIKAAEMSAHLGDHGELTRLRSEMAERADGWAKLSWAYSSLHDFQAADACARTSYELTPDSADSLTVMLECHGRHARYDDALSCARRIYELFPFEHRGPERLAELHAKRLEIEQALAYSAHAADAAPFCHVALASRALALFIAEEYDGASRYAERALMLDEPNTPDAPDDALMVLRALRGDASGLERCLELQRERYGRPQFPEFVEHLRTVARKRAASA